MEKGCGGCGEAKGFPVFEKFVKSNCTVCDKDKCNEKEFSGLKKFLGNLFSFSASVSHGQGWWQVWQPALEIRDMPIWLQMRS